MCGHEGGGGEILETPTHVLLYTPYHAVDPYDTSNNLGSFRMSPSRSARGREISAYNSHTRWVIIIVNEQAEKYEMDEIELDITPHVFCEFCL